MLSLSCPRVSMSNKAFDSGQLASCRCRWAGLTATATRAVPRRPRTPCVCSVASPAQPGLAAIEVPAQTIPSTTTASVPERISVSSLMKVVSDDLLKLNNNLKSLVGAENPVLVSAAEQIFGPGGKRLRPALVFLVSRATAELAGLSELTTEHQRLAEIIEMIHTASLIHDDVIDDSGMRRGKETIHQLYGTRVAVLAGDFMFAQSSWFLANLENIEVIKLISQCRYYAYRVPSNTSSRPRGGTRRHILLRANGPRLPRGGLPSRHVSRGSGPGLPAEWRQGPPLWRGLRALPEASLSPPAALVG